MDSGQGRPAKIVGDRPHNFAVPFPFAGRLTQLGGDRSTNPRRPQPKTEPPSSHPAAPSSAAHCCIVTTRTPNGKRRSSGHARRVISVGAGAGVICVAARLLGVGSAWKLGVSSRLEAIFWPPEYRIRSIPCQGNGLRGHTNTRGSSSVVEHRLAKAVVASSNLVSRSVPGLECHYESPSLCSVVMPAFPSTCCFLDKLADLVLDGGGESVHGKGGRPKVTVVEVCVLLETERRVP